MNNQGAIVKRCGCREPGTRRRLGCRCPRLAERGHGRWYFHCSVATMFGARERVRRGGYPTRRAAEAARDELLERSRAERTTQTWTVARWLRYWLTTRSSIRPTTLHSYTEHVDLHLIPHLGRIRLGELTGRDVAAMFTTLAVTHTRYGRPITPSTLNRIRATLRSALNAAIRDGLLRDNPARFIELPKPRRPHAQVWTDARVKMWQATGQRLAVAVWTTIQLAAFLDFIDQDRLFAMWRLIALRGLRRGEAAGLRWIDVDLDQHIIMIAQQRIAYGSTVTDGHPRPPTGAPNILLIVRGRQSGIERTTPVGMLDIDGHSYVQATYGAVGWARNLRTAGEATIIRPGGRRSPVHAIEVPPEEAAAILRRALEPYRQSHLVRRLLGSRVRPPVALLRRYRIRIDDTPQEYLAEAQRHPLFELRPA